MEPALSLFLQTGAGAVVSGRAVGCQAGTLGAVGAPSLSPGKHVFEFFLERNQRP